MIDIALLPLTAVYHAMRYLGAAVLWTWVLWVFYLAVMHLQERRDADMIPRFAYIPGMAALWVGWALDFLINVAVLTVVMIEIPRETTVTARLKRHKDDMGWRGSIARWIAAQLLDPFDPSGTHI